MSVEVYFDGLHDVIQDELKKAKESVSIAVAWIWFRGYEQVLLDLVRKGVSIEILCTESDSLQYEQQSIDKLGKSGINIRICKMPSDKNHMHHKFAVIDGNVVINGSFNWSKNASNSYENIMVIRGEDCKSREFLKEFEKIKSLDIDALTALKEVKSCGCGGHIVNLLIFDNRPMPMTEEYWGDIISLCTKCGHYKTEENGIQDTSISSLFSSYELIDDECGNISSLKLDRDVDEHFTAKYLKGRLLHGVGFTGLRFICKDEELVTTIRWKNKFVAQYINDEYEGNFDISYH